MDTTVSGLSVRGNSYHLKKMVNRVRIQKTIGKVAEIDLAEAEQLALIFVDKVRKQGRFGYEAIKANPASVIGHNSNRTLSDVAKELVEFGKKRGTRKTQSQPWKYSTVNQWEQWLNNPTLASLLGQPIRQITGQDIVDWYQHDLQRGVPTQTDNVFRKLIRVNNWAIGTGYIQNHFTQQMEHNQIRYTVKKREGRLGMSGGSNPRNELGEFAHALVTYQGVHRKKTTETIKHLVMLALLTGRRRSELMNMEWSWIDWENNIIHIPATASEHPNSPFQGVKNRKPFILPMCRLVQTMMRCRLQFARYKDENLKPHNLDFVFPGRSGNHPIKEIKKTHNLILKVANIQGGLLHDLRRTFSAVVQQVGGDFFVTKQALGHSINDITMDYLGSLPLNQKKKVFQKVSDYVSHTMPLQEFIMDGKTYNYSGTTKLLDDNVTEVKDIGWSQDAAEYLLFRESVWRDNGWEKPDLADVLRVNPD